MLETDSFHVTVLQFHGVFGPFECSETLAVLHELSSFSFFVGFFFSLAALAPSTPITRVTKTLFHVTSVLCGSF